MKRLFILVFALLIGCSIKDTWSISLEKDSSVSLFDTYSESIVLTQTEANDLIQDFNNIKDKKLNEYFNDGNGVFGHNNYSIIIESKNQKLRIGFIDYGLLNIYNYDTKEIVYYDIDLFDPFFDSTRTLAYTHGLTINDMHEYCSQDEYLKLLFTSKEDYLFGGKVKVNDFFNEIDFDFKIQEEFDFSNYILNYKSDSNMNDVIELDNLKIKVIGIQHNEIASLFVRVER